MRFRALRWARLTLTVIALPSLVAVMTVAAGAAVEDELSHMRNIIQQAELLLEEPKVLQSLSEDDIAFMRQAIEQAKSDLKEGRYARAWHTITNWRFWVLLHEKMMQSVQKDPWLVLGPFGDPKFTSTGKGGVRVTSRSFRGLETRYIPETGEIDCTGKYQVWPQKLVGWQKVVAENHVLQADPLIDQDPWMVVYAATNIYSPEEQEVKLLLGSDHGLKVWLNGEAVFAHGGKGTPRGGQRQFQPKQDVADAHLNKGWNKVLVKLVHREGTRFFFQAVNPDLKPLEDIEFATGLLQKEGYQCLLDSMSVRDITWHGEKLITMQYHYFDVRDEAGQGRGRMIARHPGGMELKPVAGGAGESAFAWEGKLSEGLDYAQQMRFLPNQIIWEMSWQAKERLFGTGPPFFSFQMMSDSPLLWGGQGKYTLSNGNEQSFQIPPYDPARKEKWSTSMSPLKAVEIETPLGLMRMEAESTDGPERGNALLVAGGCQPATGDKPADYQWRFSFRTYVPKGKSVPAGYQNRVKITLSLVRAKGEN